MINQDGSNSEVAILALEHMIQKIKDGVIKVHYLEESCEIGGIHPCNSPTRFDNVFSISYTEYYKPKKLTQEEIYKELFDARHGELSSAYLDNPNTRDYINRKANTYAVENTVRVWREQYES